MELVISVKGNKYTVQDKGQARTLYTVKKKGFGAGRYVLLDASNYNLYSLVQTGEDRKPSYIITHNDISIMQLSCKSMFLDPTILIDGKDLSKNTVKYSLASKDHRNFEILRDNGDKEKEKEKVGSIITKFTMSKDLQYEVEIDNKIFDDYIPLFAVAIDLTFGELNKNISE
ncbi:MAG: hypothetical protein NC340_07820 [Ruminococcus flavefaciens]|nr:hypothetical protein [Ruminococcus flavefaciens]MCM1228680.1 hypothetical protein [Ruminococcus flavefaciens]